MRDPGRIDKYTEKLSEMWKELPDWRLGQLMSNFARQMSYKGCDIFYMEEKQFFSELRNYINEYKAGTLF